MPHHFNDKCLVCKRRLGPNHARGRCFRHYYQAWWQVKLGLTTWKYFESMGTAKPIVRKGKK